MTVTDDAHHAIPTLPRGVRCHHDRVRNVPVLLGQERTLMLDEIGQAILGEVDDARDVAAISAALAERYNVPVVYVRADVATFLGDLSDKRLVDRAHG